jgi:tetratricopeptide (TPR) repeat protein
MTHLARIGDVDDQAPALFEEGREIATRSGDPHVLSQVLNGFGLIRLLGGCIDEARDLLLESIQRADETEDKALRVAVRYGLCLANWQTGRFLECFTVAEQGLALAEGNLGLGGDQVGFSPSLGFSYLRGAVLSLTGHPRDGEAELDRVIELARASKQLIPAQFSHFYHVLRCEVTGEAASALAHARATVEYAEQSGTTHGRMAGYLCVGIAYLLNQASQDSLEALEQALAIGRARRVLVNEAGLLAGIASAHLGLGDREEALALSEEAIALSRRLGSRVWDFSALLTRMRALREIRGLEAMREIKATLAQADAWLEMSGAKSYEPFLHVERAELARLTGDEATRERELHEAHRLFTEIGAPIRAAEVAKELRR